MGFVLGDVEVSSIKALYYKWKRVDSTFLEIFDDLNLSRNRGPRNLVFKLSYSYNGFKKESVLFPIPNLSESSWYVTLLLPSFHNVVCRLCSNKYSPLLFEIKWFSL